MAGEGVCPAATDREVPGAHSQEELAVSTLTTPLPADELIPAIDLTQLGSTVRNSVAVLLGVAVGRQILAVLATACLSRLLQPNDYGLIGMAATLTAFLQVFADLGLSWATVQRKVLTKGQIDNLFWINLAAGAFFWGLCCLAAPAVAYFFGYPQLTAVTIVTGSAFVLNGITVQPRAIFRRQLQRRQLGIVDLGSTVGGICVGVGMALTGFGYWALVGQTLGQQVVQLVLVFALSDYRPGRPARHRETLQLLQIGGWVAAAAIPIFLTRNFDNVLVGKVWGIEDLGYYSRAYFLTIFPALMLRMVADETMVPVLASLFHDKARLSSFYRSATHLLGFIGFPVGMFLVVAAPEVIRLVYGARWLPTIPVLTWLAVGNILQPVYFCFTWLILGSGKSRDYFLWQLFAAGVSCGAFVLSVPWGIQGVAAAYSAVMTLVIAPGAFFIAHRASGLHYGDTLRPIAPVLAATFLTALAMLAAAAGLAQSGCVWQWILVTKILVGAATYLALTFGVFRCAPQIADRYWQQIVRGRLRLPKPPLVARSISRALRVQIRLNSGLNAVYQRVSRPTLGIIGMYNTSNIGDLAMGHTLVRLARDARVSSGLQNFTEFRLYPRTAATLLGGGSLLTAECLRAFAARCRYDSSRVGLVGVQGLVNANELDDRVLQFLAGVPYLSLRAQEELSAWTALLGRNDIAVHPDVALAMGASCDTPLGVPSTKPGILGVSTVPMFRRPTGKEFHLDEDFRSWLVRHMPDLAEQFELLASRYVQVLVETVKVYLARGWKIHCIPFALEDDLFARLILRGLPVRHAPWSGHVPTVLQRVSKCSRFLCTRFHSHVFAALAQVPAVSIAYSLKCTYLWREFGQPEQSQVTRNDLLLPMEAVEKLADSLPAALPLAQIQRLAAAADAGCRNAVAAVCRS